MYVECVMCVHGECDVCGVCDVCTWTVVYEFFIDVHQELHLTHMH